MHYNFLPWNSVEYPTTAYVIKTHTLAHVVICANRRSELTSRVRRLHCLPHQCKHQRHDENALHSQWVRYCTPHRLGVQRSLKCVPNRLKPERNRSVVCIYVRVAARGGGPLAGSLLRCICARAPIFERGITPTINECACAPACRHFLNLEP